VGQINTAVVQLNQTTQQNAAASEELAATAEEMSSQAEQLQQAMSFFKLGAGHAASIVPIRKAVKPARSKAQPAKAAALAFAGEDIDESEFTRF
jgi:methyl-accepting chemotaxis protein